MESCLLCLEINKDILGCIRADSIQWEELEIAKTIKKHFWSLSTIQIASWICLSCWREVEGFHKFYLRIEEAHGNFGKIKLEDLAPSVECKEELPTTKPLLKDKEGEVAKENLEFCFLEPEILIDQVQQRDFLEPEIFIDQHPTHDISVDKEFLIAQSQDDTDVDDLPLKQAFKRLRLQNNLAKKDPLKKSKKYKKRRSSKGKVIATENKAENDEIDSLKVKEEPMDSNDNDSDSINEKDVSDINYQPDGYVPETSELTKCNAYSKHRSSRKENDKFIAKHFKQMFCDLCQEPLKDFPAMQTHFAETHQQRGYVVCCKRKFLNRARLVDHLHCHLNPNYFRCNECGKAMAGRRCFDNHMLSVHNANEVVRQHCCGLCGKSFTKAFALRIHKLTHLPEDEKNFPCSDCGKNYGSPYLLNQHRQAVHLKRFVKVCYVCGKEINSSAEFKTHMDKHEGIPLPVINCDVCGLRLTSKRGLKVHKASQHPVGGKQDHPCPLCEKISPTPRALKKHIVTMHEKGYDYKCSFCEKAFRRADKLKEHIATHTGTPLYSCPWCPMTFNSNGNMHSHRQNKHPKEYLELKLQKYNLA